MTANLFRPTAESVRAAQRRLAAADADARSAALMEVANLLRTRSQEILDANRADLLRAKDEALSPSLQQRLTLTPSKLTTLVEGLHNLATQPDPVGQVLTRRELDTGLLLTKVQSPIGVLLVIFESRPDAVIQIGGLAIRSGNGVLLKGGREATYSNQLLIRCLRDGLQTAGFAPDAVVGVEGRESVHALLSLDDCIDLVIPRGSSSLVRTIQQSTRIPVLGHAEGVCMLYVDKAADSTMAEHLILDGKCSYPSACNATENILVHVDFLPHLRPIGEALQRAGVLVKADERIRTVLPWAEEATEDDREREYGDLTLAAHCVESLQDAIDFIHRHGSGHTDAIVTTDEDAARSFLRQVDSASVFHNASTRFADGYRYGLGAEVGISTGRIHARGPVGVQGLMTTRWLLQGEGHRSADYGQERKAFLHKDLPID